MKNLIKSIVTLGLLLTSLVWALTPAHAIELLSYKDTATSNTIISDESVLKAFNSNNPVCFKDGAKLLGVNKAFKNAGLGYRDCSNSKAKKRIHKAQGFSVVVFKLGELSDNMIKSILGKS